MPSMGRFTRFKLVKESTLSLKFGLVLMILAQVPEAADRQLVNLLSHIVVESLTIHFSPIFGVIGPPFVLPFGKKK